MDNNLLESLEILMKYSSKDKLNNSINRLQKHLIDKDKEWINQMLEEESDIVKVLFAAKTIKPLVGQINVIIHALGIIKVLPNILEQDECIEHISLGANNASSEFDLVTNKRIAEFKFIEWNGRDSTRLKSTFIDYYNLVEYETNKDKYLYLLDSSRFTNFLKGKSTFTNVLNKSTKIRDDFNRKYGTRIKNVNEYYKMVQNQVKIIDIKI